MTNLQALQAGEVTILAQATPRPAFLLASKAGLFTV